MVGNAFVDSIGGITEFGFNPKMKIIRVLVIKRSMTQRTALSSSIIQTQETRSKHFLRGKTKDVLRGAEMDEGSIPKNKK